MMENKNPIQVADRLFLVLETLADTGSVTLAELCKHLDLNKSTVHRLLCSLIYMGYVKQDGETGKYSLSFKLTEPVTFKTCFTPVIDFVLLSIISNLFTTSE